MRILITSLTSWARLTDVTHFKHHTSAEVAQNTSNLHQTPLNLDENGTFFLMKAFLLEYRLRFLLHGVIYALGFFAPWERFTTFTLGSSTWWLFLASIPARQQWLPFTTSSQILLVLGCIAATLGAILRVWGASFLGPSIVHAGAMHGSRVLAGGPFRYVRNPLYLGTLLNGMALSLLMPPTGAIVAILLLALLQIRLVGAEESFLLNKLGEPYRLYCAAVPRFLPTFRPHLPAAGTPSPSYRKGFLSELFVVGTALSFITLGWNFNSTLILKGILISLGLSLIAIAFIPKALETSPSTSAEVGS